jgi:putative NIF3 family GTP cyclohydrolase 1 type 2
LADRSWDNVGLLVGSIDESSGALPKNPVVLLTNDLTFAVGEEAIAKGASIIISYRTSASLTTIFIFNQSTHTLFQIRSSSAG